METIARKTRPQTDLAGSNSAARRWATTRRSRGRSLKRTHLTAIVYLTQYLR